jgi:integrase/recombinase XerC
LRARARRRTIEAAVDALMTQIEAFERYLAEERRLSPRTVATYGRDLRALRDFAKDKNLRLDARRFDVVVLRSFLATLFQKNGAPTLARKIAAMRSFYRFMVKRGLTKENPAQVLKSPKVREPSPWPRAPHRAPLSVRSR